MNECVLVVDDDREIVKAIAILLERRDIGYGRHMTAWRLWTS